METVMKDDHQPDHLEVGLVTPDGTQYSYIPGSKFLWTILPLPHCMYRKCKAFFKGSIILVQVDSILLILFNIVGEQGMAQWWERSPPTNVARVQIPASTHMWVEFVVGSLLCSERFFSGYSGFPLSSKTNISKFQFDQESGRQRTTLWMCYLQIIIYLFIYLFVTCLMPLITKDIAWMMFDDVWLDLN